MAATPTCNNPYKEEIDFATLALQDADFAKILKPNGQLDFSNPESVLQLTKSLLKRDFNLKIEVALDRLCPPVPNRLNYILWIQALLDTTSDTYQDSYDSSREVVGLDIGTGASCIYPLLGCAQRPNWRFAATDIDDKSISFAKENILRNGLQGRIMPLQTKPDGPLIPMDLLGFENIDFGMCNPPFYDSNFDLLASASAKQRPPFTACTGSESEMVTAGGEVAFISRMIEESLLIQKRVQWYTSMLGKHSSLEAVVTKLRDKRVSNYAVTEFVQGNKTKRWGIAWSFGDLRPRVEVARGLNSLAKTFLPFPTEYGITLKKLDVTKAGERVNETLSNLPLKWMWKPAIATGVGFTQKAVWSRAFRRIAAQSRDSMEEDQDNFALGFKVSLLVEEDDSTVKVKIRWLRGFDSVLFESFCGMVKRKVEE
ncbi:DUF890 domain protein [Calycina marina]|uniref:DUF890 domain protein n=1 Tax=Calycina marina TaxID=1763456 RepID=A0A9P7Z5M4_9HELO|nr:DUF890 domain protein [Calycina marina]